MENVDAEYEYKKFLARKADRRRQLELEKEGTQYITAFKLWQKQNAMKRRNKKINQKIQDSNKFKKTTMSDFF